MIVIDNLIRNLGLQGLPRPAMSQHLNPGYFTSVHHPGILPTVPPPPRPPASSRPTSVNPAVARREVALGNYELARRQAEVADYNNPLDALQTELAIAAQEKALQEEEERERRHARHQERKLARALRNLRLEQSRSRSHSRSRGSRKATPYASEISASSSSESEGEQVPGSSVKDRKGKHRRQRSQSVHGYKHAEGGEAEHDDHTTRERAKTVGQGSHNADHGIWQDSNARHVLSGPDSTRATAHTSSNSRSTMSKASKSASTHSAVVTRKDGPKYSSTGLSTSPTKPHHIEYAAATSNEASNVIEPDTELLHLIFHSSEEFILTHAELIRGGPSNSFLSSWRKSPHHLPKGGLLTIQMPEDRDAKLFRVIHEYLKGHEIIPLNAEHSLLLCGEHTPMKDAYKKLYREAALYGMRNLVEDISAFYALLGKESRHTARRSRKLNTTSEYPVHIRDYASLATGPSAILPIRAVVTGAAINFMTRPVKGRAFILVFSLVAPMTSSSQGLHDAVGYTADIASRQIFLEGTLTREECRNVVLDIMYRQRAESPGPGGPHSEVKRLPLTLEHLYKAFLPSRRRQLRPQLVETFDIHYFEHSEADEKEDETDSADPTSKYYINLPYTTVVLRVDTQEGQSDNKKVVFEQIHTATREILFSRAR